MDDFEIYSLFFVYDENLLDGSKGKERPCLVVKSNYLGKELFYPITGTKRDKHYEIRDWQQAGLEKPSYLVYDKSRDLQMLGNPNLTKVGKLSDYDIQRIKSQRLLQDCFQQRKQYSSLTESLLKEAWNSNGSLEDFDPQALVDKAFNNKHATNSVREHSGNLLYINVDPNFLFGNRNSTDKIWIDVIQIDPDTNEQTSIYKDSANDPAEVVELLNTWKDQYLNSDSPEDEDEEPPIPDDEESDEDYVEISGEEEQIDGTEEI